jgi:hypothetical protein
MPTTTTKAALVEDALIAQLKLRAGLSGVQVEVGPLGDESDASEYIQTVGEPGALSSTQTWGALGNRRKDEAVTIRGEVFVERPGAGALVIREVRDRALELMEEVETQLRDDPHINGLVVKSALTGWDEQRGVTPGGRTSVISFIIEYEAWLPRT